jgi:methylglutaconyl-CoA hydratase
VDVSLVIETTDHVAILTLDRPELHNAFDGVLIERLTAAYRTASADPAVRAVVLRANGRSFSAGADLTWMRRMAEYDTAENLADSRALAELMRTIDTCEKPTLVRIHGPAFAGALGLIACSDIAISVPEAIFGVTEVRLGIIPSVISPYLVRAMGARAARRWFLTAERFSADEALRLGLIHEIVSAERLDAIIQERLASLCAAGPMALMAAKRLVERVAGCLIDPELIEESAARIAAIRTSPEGREGITAFLERRKPSWAL